jgi:uncharacterized protein YdeI (YjbR/CyaY-like superfamily)
MKTSKTLYVTNGADWRSWLEKYHESKTEIWLVFYKKHTGRPRISYEDAVEEALCFGWIDSIVKRVDEEKYIQKFSPRKDLSTWSESNRRRVKKLIEEGRMTSFGLSKFKDAGPEKQAVKIPNNKVLIPPDLKRALVADKKAWQNFSNFAPGYRKNYIFWVSSAKREETRAKRIREAVQLIAQNTKVLMK